MTTPDVPPAALTDQECGAIVGASLNPARVLAGRDGHEGSEPDVLLTTVSAILAVREQRWRERVEAVERERDALLSERDVWREAGAQPSFSAFAVRTAQAALARAEAAEERLRAVAALHRPDGGSTGPGAMCVHCTPDFGTPAEDPVGFPCATVRAVLGQTGTGEGR